MTKGKQIVLNPRAAKFGAMALIIVLSGCANSLYDAADRGDVEALRSAFNADRSSIDKPAFNGDLPLHRAAWQGHLDTVKFLIQAGAELDARNRKGNTALALATLMKHWPTAKYLAEKGADPDIPNDVSDTPIINAALDDQTQLLRLLAVSSKRIDYRNSKGESALSIAAYHKKPNSVEVLLEAGANVDQRVGPFSNTPLLSASAAGSSEIIRILLDAGSDITLRNTQGASAISYAAEFGHTEALNALLEAGADPNSALNDGTTALHAAAGFQRFSTVQILLDAGADRYARVNGVTPAEIARQRGHTNIAQYIDSYRTPHKQAANSSPNQEESKPERASDNKKSTEPTLASTGTVFRVTNQGAFVSNAHVVDNCQRVEIAGQAAKVINIDRQNDLALLKSFSGPAATIRDRRAVRTGDRVMTLGFPYASILGTDLNASSGEVSALSGIRNDTRYLQMSASANPGNSGGPLVNSAGTVVGVVTGVLNPLEIAKRSGNIPKNINFSLKASILKAFLDQSGVGYVTGDPIEKIDPAEIVDAARRYTFKLNCFK